MSKRSMTVLASPVSAQFALVIVMLLAMLFAMMQSAGIQPFGPAASRAAGAPLYRGIVQLFHRDGAPADENQMAVAQRIDRWQPYITEASARYALPASWIRTIINIESSGRTMKNGHPISSGAGRGRRDAADAGYL